MHRCRRGKAPQYLVDCCTPVTDVVGRQHLRSASQQLMVVPRPRLSIVGRQAFAVHGPMVWNSLPDDLRAQQDYESFRRAWKPGFSPDTSVFNAFETFVVISLYKSTFTIPYHHWDSAWIKGFTQRMHRKQRRCFRCVNCIKFNAVKNQTRMFVNSVTYWYVAYTLVWIALNFMQGLDVLSCVACDACIVCAALNLYAGIACKVITLNFMERTHCKQWACVKLYWGC